MKKIFKNGELGEKSVIRKIRTTADGGKISSNMSKSVNEYKRNNTIHTLSGSRIKCGMTKGV